MQGLHSWVLAAALLAAASQSSCRKRAFGVGDAGTEAAAVSESVQAPPSGPAPASVASGPKIGAVSVQVNVYGRPDPSSKRSGYLRLGAVVARDDKPATTQGCPGGWYRVYPRGYVCAGDEATTDLDHPLVRASSVRPDLTKPLPYKYAFVRAVAPLYLKVPTAAEQYAAEFKLKEHLEWWKADGEGASHVELGANDVPLDARGVALPKAEAAKVAARRSPDLSLGELLGGQGPEDPIPFWLQSGRSIPNISGFKVPTYATFANRVRRHTGLALVGSFATGPDSLERRFAITVDLRLVPASKIKPDAASPFHGTALGDERTLPVAFVRAQCNSDKEHTKECAHPYKLTESGVSAEERSIPWRRLFAMSGASRKVGGSLYRETKDGMWLKASDLAVVSPPTEWPSVATAGQKWIDVSIENQTLTLWEGQRPVYVTLVSTGQDGLKDPKTTKSTITGTFRILSKHVTATMDSNEGSSEGGVGGSGAAAPSTEEEVDSKDKAKPLASDRPVAPEKPARDPRRRRGEGTFELRDVPYVQYFKSGYALHAAYWHDVFGTARSHGCINLAPIDAHHLFQWTDPPIPEGWHGVTSGAEAGEGTTITVHK